MEMTLKIPVYSNVMFTHSFQAQPVYTFVE